MSVASNLKNSQQQTSTGASAIIQNWTTSAQQHQQQQQLHQNSTTAATTAAAAGRRILPSPVLKQVGFQDWPKLVPHHVFQMKLASKIGPIHSMQYV